MHYCLRPLPLLAAFGLIITLHLEAQETTPKSASEIPSPAPNLTAEEKYQRARNMALGQGVPKNVDEAYRHLLEASGEGHAEATGAIGIFHQNGWAGLMPNEKEAVAWYKKGYEMGGLRAGYNYGLMLVNGLGVEANVDEGLPLIEKAVDARIPEACLVYGSYYYFGKFGKSQDYAKAFELIEVAAKAGNPDAENMLGIMYEHGKGIDIDHEQAIEWYRRAALQNLPKAQANLGILLGPDVQDPERRAEALRWLHIGAANNEITAEKTLQAIQFSARPEEMETAKREALKFRLLTIRARRATE